MQQIGVSLVNTGVEWRVISGNLFSFFLALHVLGGVIATLHLNLPTWVVYLMNRYAMTASCRDVNFYC